MKKFKIVRDPYNEKEYLFNKGEISISEGITVLVGCNGTGKSTLQQAILRQLKKEKIPHVYWDNHKDDKDTDAGYLAMQGDYGLLANNFAASEGEQIANKLDRIVAKTGNVVRSLRKEDNQFWLIMDAVDSGYSVDNIVELKDFIKKVLIPDLAKVNKKCYILISANEYEMARNEACFDVYNCEYITFKDYEEYRNFILNSKDIKIKRYRED